MPLEYQTADEYNEAVPRSWLETLNSTHLYYHKIGLPSFCPECGLSQWVELGGGEANTAYHPNIDIIRHPNVDITHDLRTGIPLHNDHADRLKSINFIMHLGCYDLDHFFAECIRVLRPGGSLYILTTDIAWLCKQVVDHGLKDWVAFGIWGEQTPEHPGDFHTWGFDFERLSRHLTYAGFSQISHRGHYNPWDFRLEAFK
jgi:predicted SAM-dependent methyltransferase